MLGEMRRSAAVIGSIAVHAILLVVVLVLREGHHPVALVEPAPHAELTQVDLVPRAKPAPPPTGGGGGDGGGVAQAAPRRAAVTPRTTSVASYLGRVTVVSDTGTGTGSGAGGGTGGGYGGGTGTGFGLGTGSGIERDELPPPPPPPPAPVISKARPPILIYPKRTGEAEEGDTFLARVKIDNEGYVVGAKIVRGLGPNQNMTASELIWRFRYLPALDDAGTPISWTLDQPFLVQ
jgi:hypothetical protein